MSLKTKVQVTVVGLLVAFAAFHVATGQIVDDGDETYLLSVKWFPATMPIYSEVHITATVDGVPLIQRTRRLSPWGETLMAEKGSIVRLTATAVHPATNYLDCIILRNGKSVPSTGFDSLRDSPGMVECST